MAQIDELIAAMTARRADALILNSDQPAQLNFGGTLARGDVVPAALLRDMLTEILPDNQKFQLVKSEYFEFVHSCPHGQFRLQINGRLTSISLVITPLLAGLARRNQPASHKTPDLSKLGSAVANSTHVHSAPKPSVGVVPVVCAIVGYLFILKVLIAPLGASLPFTFFFFIAIGIWADASGLGVRKGLVDGWADLEPWQWFLLCLVFNFIGIPAYLVARPVYKSALPPSRVPPSRVPPP